MFGRQNDEHRAILKSVKLIWAAFVGRLRALGVGNREYIAELAEQMRRKREEALVSVHTDEIPVTRISVDPSIDDGYSRRRKRKKRKKKEEKIEFHLPWTNY